ncbi:glycine cleavage system aminomethyltransferase GcvT [Candidatus Thiosymbion oneisti]|uniref:glycine cleavage system aminomethyltransferase GcvT n=1 Tax=Candidatus Thiosymbion oneisti TaxID=589554 RepID=UPI000A4A91AE|nr:glycine cleavage system aminomethyltransferase GcvT [Candidatus Thiosymbion oneisti]
MGYKTPLFDEHRALGARIVPFGGWDMPLHYGSQVREHHQVRLDAGMFDVSHMRIIDLEGSGASAFLGRLIANDPARLRVPGQALYSCMLNRQGGVIDDLILYFRAPSRYRLVVNAATAEKDLAWIRDQAVGMAIAIRPRRDLAMIAVQGPNARAKAVALIPAALRERSLALKPFVAAEQGDWFISRTGYTGEDGLELICPADEVPALWRGLKGAEVAPCGLGARDTLRLEAGLNLSGQDMDEAVSPLESGLAWTVAWEPAERDFIGRSALEVQRERGGLRRCVGLLLTGRGVLRRQQAVLRDGKPVGEVTSGGFAPTLQRSIAFARIAPGSGEECRVLIHDKAVPARVVKPPFVRNGKPRIDL